MDIKVLVFFALQITVSMFIILEFLAKPEFTKKSYKTVSKPILFKYIVHK